ncbi:MAG: hypothetical protein ACK4TA_02900 [Saprospiraceae bacterium]
MSDTPPILKGSAPDPSDTSWVEHARSEQQQQALRLEETAKYLAGIIAISLTIFIDKRPANLAAWTGDVLTGAALVWMGAAFLSFLVLFPWRYRYAPDSPDDIRRAFRRVVQVKWALLVAATVCFLVALGMGVWAFLKG